ncbi:hypothetical protein DFH09DRAFT_1070720 [Mycena vulgaris]|nr:hypothetical protein DFH09DRAFT_1070720 [Mycena vulgaris]
MRPSVNLKGLDATEDAFTFRETRSGRVLSPWDAEEISTSTTFSIADAVTDLEALHLGDNEDLAELDSGPPHIPLPTSSDTLVEPSHVELKTPSQIARATRDKARSKAKRQAARSANSKTDILLEERPRHPRHLRTAGPSIEAQFNLRKVRIAATGWIGLRDSGVSPEEAEAGVKQEGYTPIHLLPEFFGAKAIFHGFHLAKYLGPQGRPIVDQRGKVCAVFGGRPPEDDFMETVHDPAVEAMETARAQCSLADERLLHRRGNWAPLTKGASFGGGQTEPGELLNGVINTAVLCCLVSNLAFIRFAGFATGVFAAWAPDLFDFYVDYMRLFYSHYPQLRRPFLNGIWSAVTFNLGPQMCARGHRDFANLAYGWCAITALGNFDYTKGGHLILWDCKLIIEFPPGTTILIPSAAIFHSNIPVAEGEHRYSFTQYTAGGLFRWVEHGFKTEEEYLEGLSKRERREERELGKERASEGVGLFSTIAELKAMA